METRFLFFHFKFSLNWKFETPNEGESGTLLDSPKPCGAPQINGCRVIGGGTANSPAYESETDR